MNYQQRKSNTKRWVATPLNRIGDLDSWINRMHRACPDPQLNQVVWLNSDKKSTGYKVLGFKRTGEVIWQRGKVVWHK
jgi:hypothetical protein